MDNGKSRVESGIATDSGRTRDELSVVRSLRGFWGVTTYTGAMVDWCHQNSWTCCGATLRYFCTGCVFALSCFVAGFEFYQIFLSLIDPKISMTKTIPLILWFVPFSLSAIIQINFLTRKERIKSLLDAWSAFDEETQLCGTQTISSRFLVTSMSYFFMALCSISGLVYIIFTEQENSPHFLMSLKFFQGPITFPLAVIIHLLAILYCWILIPLADIVPPVFFFHLAKCFDNLRGGIDTVKFQMVAPGTDTQAWAIKKISSKTGYTKLILQSTWNRYEMIRSMTREANDIFGVVTLLNHGALFLMMCSVYYYIPTAIPLDDVISLLSYTSNAVIITARAIISILLSCYLYHSTTKLRDYFANFVSRNWFLMSEDEREIATGFLSRLQEGPLTVNPLYMYSITPSTLLSLASIVVTYCIVLLQSGTSTKS